MNPLRRIDVTGPLLAAASLVIFLLHGFEHRLKHDMALYAYAGQQLADGVPPYVAVLNRAGPLSHAVPGLGALGGEWFDKDQLLAIRALMMLLSVACVWLAYLVGRDIFGSRLCGLVSGATLLTFHGFVDYATGGPREKTTMVLFLLALLVALSRRSWLLAGGAVALATLTWQPAFFPGAAAALVAAGLLPGWSARLRALGRFTVGGLAVLSATVLAFAAAGALDAFYEGFLAVHLGGYTTQAGVLDAPARAARHVVNGFGWSTALLALGSAATVVLAALRLRGPDRTSAPAATTIALGAGTLVCLAWSCTAFQAWGDAMVILPFAVAGMGGVAHAVRAALPDRWGSRTLVTAALVMVVVAAITSWTGRPEGLAEERALARNMFRAAGPGATVQSFQALEPLVFTGRTNPSRYVNFVGGFHRYLDDTLPGGLASLAQDVERRRPTLIVMGKTHGQAFRWLRPTLREHYRLVGGDETFDFWYVARSEDMRIGRLRAVLRAAELPIGPAAVKRSVP